ncbi:MAG: hypothetical protein EOO45_11810 [Flavobacterium sp.]|nr:MAG: hypothetical protein EOO45_11810 [Flavobacterium sp.]
MKKILRLLSLFVVLYSSGGIAQTNGNAETALLQKADAMGRAFIAKDYPAFTKFTHPAIVLLMGGEKNVLEYTTKSFAELEAEGIEFSNVTFAAPSEILSVDGELQSTLQQMIEMKVQGGTLTVATTLIAVSRDNGANWYFVDASGNDVAMMRKTIANLSPRLNLPPNPDPVFVEDPVKH